MGFLVVSGCEYRWAVSGSLTLVAEVGHANTTVSRVYAVRRMVLSKRFGSRQGFGMHMFYKKNNLDFEFF